MKYRYCNRENDSNTMLSVNCSDGRLYISTGIKKQYGELDSLTGYVLNNESQTTANYKLMEFMLTVKRKYDGIFSNTGYMPTKSELKSSLSIKRRVIKEVGISIGDILSFYSKEKPGIKQISSCICDEVLSKKMSTNTPFSEMIKLPSELMDEIKKRGLKGTTEELYLYEIHRAVRGYVRTHGCINSKYIMSALLLSEYIGGKTVSRHGDHGFVYMVSSEFGFKIGISKRPVNRNSVFGVKLPFKTEMIRCEMVPEYKLAESVLHKAFGEKRINGEWFDLTSEDIDIFDSEIEKLKS